MQKLLLFILNLLIFPLRKLPLRVHYKLSGFIYWLSFKIIRYRRDDVTVNLTKCFPEEDYYGIKIIREKFYRHFADIIVEAIWFGGCRNPKRLHNQRIMRIVNPEELNRLYAIAPSMMVLYSHCGNWELFGGMDNYTYDAPVPEPLKEDKVKVVYRAAHNKLADAFIKNNRFTPINNQANFDGYIESRNLVRYALTNRNRKLMYNVNTDQRPYYAGSDNMKVNFMGMTIKTMSAAAALAHKCHMSVSFLKMDIESRGHYKLEYVTICDDASGMSVQEIMDKYYQLLEEEIRQQPWNYLWTHRRLMS